jgi:hypothetical protein
MGVRPTVARWVDIGAEVAGEGLTGVTWVDIGSEVAGKNTLPPVYTVILVESGG